jgi:hypothetical protein
MLHPIAAQYGIITLPINDYDNQIIGLQRLFADRIMKMADSYHHLRDWKTPITSHSVAQKYAYRDIWKDYMRYGQFYAPF